MPYNSHNMSYYVTSNSEYIGNKISNICEEGDIKLLKAFNDEFPNLCDNSSLVMAYEACNGISKGLKTKGSIFEITAIEIIDYLINFMNVPIITSIFDDISNNFLIDISYECAGSIIKYIIDSGYSNGVIKGHFKIRAYESYPITNAINRQNFDYFKFCFEELNYTWEVLYSDAFMLQTIYNIDSNSMFNKVLDYFKNELKADLMGYSNYFSTSDYNKSFKLLRYVFILIVDDGIEDSSRVEKIVKCLNMKKTLFKDDQNSIILNGITSTKNLHRYNYNIFNSICDQLEYTKDDIIKYNIISNLILDSHYTCLENIFNKFDITKDDITIEILKDCLQYYNADTRIKFLIDKLGIDKEFFRSNGNEFLFNVCNSKFFYPEHIYKLLILDNKFYNNEDFINDTLIISLVINSNINTLEYLLSINIITKDDFEDNAVILDAVESNNIDMIRYILDVLNIPIKSDYQFNLVKSCLLNLDYYDVNYVFNKLNIDKTYIYTSDAIMSILNNDLGEENVSTLKYNILTNNIKMLFNNSDINIIRFSHIYTAIRLPAAIKLFKYMFNKWYNNDRKVKPLIIREACNQGNLEAIKIIFNKMNVVSSDIYTQDLYGKSALDYAVKYPDLLKYLNDYILTNTPINKERLAMLVSKFGVPDECVICYEDMPKSNMLVGVICGHCTTCTDCFAKICQFENDQDSTALLCPICKQKNIYIPVTEVI